MSADRTDDSQIVAIANTTSPPPITVRDITILHVRPGVRGGIVMVGGDKGPVFIYEKYYSYFFGGREPPDLCTERHTSFLASFLSPSSSSSRHNKWWEMPSSPAQPLPNVSLFCIPLVGRPPSCRTPLRPSVPWKPFVCPSPTVRASLDGASKGNDKKTGEPLSRPCRVQRGTRGRQAEWEVVMMEEKKK